MLASRALLLVPFVFVPAAPAAEDEIAFGVAQETTLVRTLKSNHALELESMALIVNGEEVPSEMLGEMDVRIEHGESYVVTDVFERVEDGRPRRLRRTFDELSGSETARFTSEEGEESDDTDYESALEGQSVVFTWDEDAREFEAAFAEGSEGEGELLAELEEDMDLRRLLPDGAVSEGDSWEVEARAFECIVDPGGELALRDPESDEDRGDEFDAELRDNMSGTITARHAGTRVVDGVRAAVIRLDAETETHAEQPLAEEDLIPGGSGTSRVESRYRVEGELVWDLEHGHALSLELSGESGLTMGQSMSAEHEGESLEQSQTMVFAGRVTFSMRFERK